MPARGSGRDSQVTCMTCPLRRVCIPAPLAEDDVPEFDAIVARGATVSAGLDVVMPGQIFEKIHILRVGVLQEFVISWRGERRIIGYSLPSDMVGFDGFAADRHVSGARTLETTAICEVRRDDLLSLATAHPELMDQALVKAGQRLVAVQRLQLVVSRHTARERVAAMLLSHAARAERIRWSGTRLRLPMAYAEIAQALGISAEAMSRTLHQLAGEGIITVSRSEITIVDRQRLEEAANGPVEYIPPESA